MKTFRQKGDNLDFQNASGSTMTSGTPYLIGGATIGIPVADIPAGTLGEVSVEQCFTVPKVTGRAWVVGNTLFWDVSASAFDVLAGTPATGDVKGCAIVAEAAASGATTGTAKLCPGAGTVV